VDQLSERRATDWNSWAETLWTLKTIYVGSQEGLAVAHKFSRKAGNEYDEEATEKMYHLGKGHLGFGTLQKAARDDLNEREMVRLNVAASSMDPSPKEAEARGLAANDAADTDDCDHPMQEAASAEQKQQQSQAERPDLESAAALERDKQLTQIQDDLDSFEKRLRDLEQQISESRTISSYVAFRHSSSFKINRLRLRLIPCSLRTTGKWNQIKLQNLFKGSTSISFAIISNDAGSLYFASTALPD